MYPWERVRDFAQSMGANVQLVTKHDMWGDKPKGFVGAERLKRVLYAPACHNLALHWKKKLIYMVGDARHDRETVGNMVHELGHIVACRTHPDNSDEPDFLGWEWQVAKLVRIPRQWMFALKDYGIEGGQLGEFPKQERLRILRAHVEKGKDYGNIDRYGRPRAVR